MTGTTRRQFVSALLGSSAALSGCRPSKRQPSIPDGELRLPGRRLGHSLRDRALSTTPAVASHWESAEVAIVGAGVAGLTAAWWLRRQGLENLVVLDLDSTSGGTSQGGTSDVTSFPWGAHYIVAPTERQKPLVQLLREVGSLSLLDPSPRVLPEAKCRQPEERIYHQGRWHEGLYLRAGASAEDRRQRRLFDAAIGRWVAYRDAAGKRAFDLPCAAASDSPMVRELDTLSFGTWLDRQGFTSSRLRWLTDYACRDDYGLKEADTSAWAGLMYFAARLNEPGSDSRAVLTWPEGNSRLTTHLASGLEHRLRLQTAVTNVYERSGWVELLAHTPWGARGVRAKRAIVATPQFVSRRIVQEFRDQPQPESQPDRGAWAVANLHLADAPQMRSGDCPLAWDNVLRASPSLGYVVADHQRRTEQSEPTVLTWYYPFTGTGSQARQLLDSASREDWASVALSDLAEAHRDIRSLCRRVDVTYWGHGMVRPRPGHIFSPERLRANAAHGSIHFANTELSGVALFEEAFAHGIRAANEVLSARGHTK